MAKRKKRSRARPEADPLRGLRRDAEQEGNATQLAVSFLQAADIQISSRTSLQRRRKRLRVSWPELVDALVMEQKSDDLLASVVRHLDASGLGLRATKGKRGVVLHRDSAPLALVCATSASFRRAKPINADFLHSGPHWLELRQKLAMLVQRADAPREATERAHAAEQIRVLTSLPASIDPSLSAAATEASQRIRIERTLAFGHPVVLVTNSLKVRFEPVTSIRGPMEVPVSFHSIAGDTVDVWLRLRTAGDPLAVTFVDGADEQLVVRAWLFALIGFAELTCGGVSGESMLVQPRRRPRGASTGQTRHPRKEGRGRGLALSDSLTPIGETARYAAAYVAGHRRRLPSGKRCGAEARAAARAIGIELHPGETWVRPHARGLPEDAELQFRWQPDGLDV